VLVTILAGGTGSIKLVRGFSRQGIHTSVISNVSDNFWYNGLYVCPDLDTMIYGLSDVLDRERGWGIQGDTFNSLRQMRLLNEDSWFRLGDRDLVTHLIRTSLLRKGKSITFVTNYLRDKFGIKSKIIPATNSHVETRMKTIAGNLHIQEFWVKYKGRLEIKKIWYEGIKKAKANKLALRSINKADIVVFAPGNPISSIGPILAINEVRNTLRNNRKKSIAVSPLVGNTAISGPAKNYMKVSGIEISVAGLVSIYKDVISRIVIGKSDLNYQRKISNMDVKPYLSNILMRTKTEEDRLAKRILKIMEKN
jgi:LPPG:FO 2-phospho-L-lactate transferase